MRFERPDRALLLDDSFGEEFLKAVRESGAVVETDRIEQVPVNLDPLPALKDWRLTRAGLKDLAGRLNPDDPERLPKDWADRVGRWRSREHILQLTVHRGFFLSLGVHNWGSFEAAMETVCDDPGLVEEAMALYGDFNSRVAARVLDEVEVDLASFSEPIAGAGGPLLSPRMYERFALANYRPVLSVLGRFGVETTALVSWADADCLLPSLLDSGFNCLWAHETVGGAMDYLSLRRRFGKALRLIGGIDLDAVLAGNGPLRREFSEKVAPLLAQGGYAPLADGRMRDATPLRNYLEYRRLLEEFASGEKA